ncbi:MAG: TlpA disulfide reductase family protein, partial [Gemmatimonadota bacterium]
DGVSISLDAYRGRVVLLNFWGTWCAPCRYEIPELADVQRAYGDRGGVVIGVAIESGEPADIRAFAREYGVNYPIWISTSDVAVGRFGVIGYPFTLLIDKNGRIRHEWVGPQSVSSLSGPIEELLAEPAS